MGDGTRACVGGEGGIERGPAGAGSVTQGEPRDGHGHQLWAQAPPELSRHPGCGSDGPPGSM